MCVIVRKVWPRGDFLIAIDETVVTFLILSTGWSMHTIVDSTVTAITQRDSWIESLLCLIGYCFVLSRSSHQSIVSRSLTFLSSCHSRCRHEVDNRSIPQYTLHPGTEMSREIWLLVFLVLYLVLYFDFILDFILSGFIIPYTCWRKKVLTVCSNKDYMLF